jgi:hypothetical protein
VNTPPPPDLSVAPLIVRSIAPDEQIEAFRAVHVADPADADLPLSFRSHYETPLKPQPLETDRTALYMAVSFWLAPEPIIALARRLPKLGRFLARVDLGYGSGFDYLDRTLERNPQHLTIWGAREKLAGAVVDIVPIDPP